MRNTVSILLFGVSLLCAASAANAANSDRVQQAQSELLALCYHDVVHTEEATKLDQMAITVDMLVQHLSWLAGEGYTPITLKQWHSDAPLPEKPVLLTFDDGYKSFRTVVLPLLELYEFPAVLAPVTSWIDTPADKPVNYGGEMRARGDFLDWHDLAEVTASGLVEVVSHSHDLHQGILANGFGNLQPRANAFAYLPAEARYETDEEYRQRITSDLARSRTLLAERVEGELETIVWPYGAYHEAANAAAAREGFTEFMTLEDIPNKRHTRGIHRALVSSATDLAELRSLTRGTKQSTPLRAVHVDLDYVYDSDVDQLNRNLDLLLDRIKAMRISTVFLQAFADPDGDGVANALYFPNRHMPVRADLFNRVTWQLRTRAGVQVYAWMPVLAFELPDENLNNALAVRSGDGSHTQRYHRLSPFNAEAQRVIREIYADLGRSVDFAGVLYHDDAFLTDHEDVSLEAKAFARRLGVDTLTMGQKTNALLDFTDELTSVLRRWQPGLKTARNLYAQVVLNPESEAWFAQNFEAFLTRYDYTALMSMPYLEEAKRPRAWLRKLISQVEKSDPSLRRTVFHMQTRDWRTEESISNRTLARHFKLLLTRGVRHIAYYPDDFYNNHPALEMVRERLSINDFPALQEGEAGP